jgi:tetratricopeptide (TPR) repeat protein
VVESEASLVDVMPTLLQALRIPAPPSVQGRSLLSELLGRSGSTTSNLYAENYLPLLHYRWSRLLGLQWHGLKYIDAPRPELYETRSDPRETQNLFQTRQAVAHEIRDKLLAVLRRYTPAAGGAPSARELTDPALLERLRSLGYVAVSAGTFSDASRGTLPDPKDRIQVYELVADAIVDGQHGRYDESLAKLRQAQNTEPASLTIQYLLAQDGYRLKDFRHAIEYFQSALKLDPKFALAEYYLGVSKLEMGDLEGAAASFHRVLELDPTNFSAAFNLGVVYSRQQRTDEALGAFQQAAEILPDYAEAHEALGEIYLYLRRPDEAVRELERAVAIAPGMRKAHHHLGRAYEAKGLHEKAQQEFERAKTP